MSANEEEIRRRLYVNIIKGARTTNANNRPQLLESKCVLFTNKHLQTHAEPKMQSNKEMKK